MQIFNRLCKTDSKQRGCRCRSPPRALVLQVHLTKLGESQNQDSALANSAKLCCFKRMLRLLRCKGKRVGRLFLTMCTTKITHFDGSWQRLSATMRIKCSIIRCTSSWSSLSTHWTNKAVALLLKKSLIWLWASSADVRLASFKKQAFHVSGTNGSSDVSELKV